MVTVATTALRGMPWLTLTKAALGRLEASDGAWERSEEATAVAELYAAA